MSWKNTLQDRLWRTGRLAGNEGIFKLYIKEQLKRRNKQLEEHPAKTSDRNRAEERIAQEIAMFIDSAAFRGFPANNPYMEIMLVAQELGHPSDNRAEGANWERLTALVNELPVTTSERLAARLGEIEQLEGNEELLKTYLEDEIGRRSLYPDLERDIAYDIAGIMASPAFQDVAPDNPYMEILLIAGELELPPQHRDNSSTWGRLIALVRDLP